MKLLDMTEPTMDEDVPRNINHELLRANLNASDQDIDNNEFIDANLYESAPSIARKQELKPVLLDSQPRIINHN
jgi:hypothetical protein